MISIYLIKDLPNSQGYVMHIVNTLATFAQCIVSERNFLHYQSSGRTQFLYGGSVFLLSSVEDTLLCKMHIYNIHYISQRVAYPQPLRWHIGFTNGLCI